MQSLIEALRNQIVMASNSAYRNASLLIENSVQYRKAQQELLMSNRSQTAQVFQYYPSPSIQLSSSWFNVLLLGWFK